MEPSMFVHQEARLGRARPSGPHCCYKTVKHHAICLYYVSCHCCVTFRFFLSVLSMLLLLINQMPSGRLGLGTPVMVCLFGIGTHSARLGLQGFSWGRGWATLEILCKILGEGV